VYLTSNLPTLVRWPHLSWILIPLLGIEILADVDQQPTNLSYSADPLLMLTLIYYEKKKYYFMAKTSVDSLISSSERKSQDYLVKISFWLHSYPL